MLIIHQLKLFSQISAWTADDNRNLLHYLKWSGDLIELEIEGESEADRLALIPGEYCTYMHIAPDGKIYIGETKDDHKIDGEFPSRWGKNGSGYSQNYKMSMALEKYPWNEWEHLFIARNISKTTAVDLEWYFIDYFDSYHHGLNLNEGGKGVPRGKKGAPPRITPILVKWDDGSFNIFPTQKAAALATGKQASNVSDYVNRKKPQKNIGMEFSRVQYHPLQ